MTLPVRALPLVQNWDCHGCGGCCKEYRVQVTAEERERIQKQGWDKEAGFEGVRLFVRDGPFWSDRWRLNHRADGSCVFLNEQGLCKIHAKFGPEGKPLPCRVYPFVLVPAGDHWRVGLRYACPSSAGNKGRALAEHQGEVQAYAHALELRITEDVPRLPPPPLRPGQRVDWPDLLLFARALGSLIRARNEPIERRLRKCLGLATICKQATFETVTGRRLAEFLNLVGAGLDAEVPADPTTLPAPGWTGRVLFRQLAAVYARKDQGPVRGTSRHGRLALLWAATRVARGSGRVPRLHGEMGHVTFADLERPTGPLSPASEAMLERYYAVKLESLQFCGRSNFDLPFWDGLSSLALTYPAARWLSRAFPHMTPEAAFERALRIVDDNFGFNPLLGGVRQRLALRTMSATGEVARLVAWYSR